MEKEKIARGNRAERGEGGRKKQGSRAKHRERRHKKVIATGYREERGMKR